jgi:hypothetical protein
VLKEEVRPREEYAEQSKKNEGKGDQKRGAHPMHAKTLTPSEGSNNTTSKSVRGLSWQLDPPTRIATVAPTATSDPPSARNGS